MNKWKAEEVKKYAVATEVWGEPVVTEMLKAFAARLKLDESANVVGHLSVAKWRGMSNHDFDYLMDLPDGNYPLYLHPPAQAAQERDALDAARYRRLRQLLNVDVCSNEASSIRNVIEDSIHLGSACLEMHLDAAPTPIPPQGDRS